MVKRFLLAVVLLVACSLLPAARKALVIGNAHYQDKPLKNTINDARDIKAKLDSLGFKVQIFEDTDLEQMDRAIWNWTEAMDSSDEAVFYYAGHGAQVQGENYLLPINQVMRDEISVVNKSYKCNELLSRMKKPRVSIIFLDACRNNPFSGTRSLTRGLASMHVPLPSQCVVFSTLAGQEALDGDESDRNSPFAQALLKYLSLPMRFDDVFRKVQSEVETLTGNLQSPFMNGLLRDNYYFVPEPISDPFADYQASPSGPKVTPQTQTQLDAIINMPLPAQTAIKTPEQIIVSPGSTRTETPKQGAKEPELVVVSVPPSTKKPVTPAYEPPKTEPPRFEQPKLSPSVVEQPKTEQPKPTPTVSEPVKTDIPTLKSSAPVSDPPKVASSGLDLSKVEQLRLDTQKIATGQTEQAKPEAAVPQIVIPKSNTVELKNPELALNQPATPVQTAQPKDKQQLEYGSVEVLSNVDGEIYLDNSTTAYKSINKNSILRIDQLHTGNCRITFKSPRYSDSKDVFIIRNQTQSLNFSFPEPIAPTGFVSIPGGSFNMGSQDGAADEKPVRTVTISPFSMSVGEITIAQFRQFVKSSGYKTTAELNGKSTVVDKKSGNFKAEKGINWQNPGYDITDNYPVACVSWYDALAYCNWRSEQEKLSPAYSINGNPYPKDWSKGQITWSLNARGYRLPTEAEWECAARGGASNQRFSGSNLVDEVAIYAVNAGWQASYGGSRKSNGYGLFDMSGNLAEWCWDWYDDSYYSKKENNDPLGPLYPSRKGTPTRVVRGGSWYSRSDRCTVSSRDKAEPDNQENGIGFRIVKNTR